MPADSTTARTPPPAMMPVPSGAGLSSTLPAPKWPTTGCGTVVPFIGTRIRFFFAASIALRMADGTSFALPTPKPTTPAPSPTTTSALKLRFLPPLTTFVTRLICTTVSFSSSCEASIFSRVPIFFMNSNLSGGNPWTPPGSLASGGPLPRAARGALKLQARFACCFGDCAHAPVIQVSAAIEHDARHALFLPARRDGFADRSRTRLVAGLCIFRERALQRRLGRCRRDNGRARHVIDDLRVGMRQAAIHSQTRPLGRAGHPLPLTQMNPFALVLLRLNPHNSQAPGYAPVFPAFFFNTSPV